ncbi:unnamed protein product [Effrenium voratum]|nr:unnamed protein product [Effrenium voratum]
MKLHPAPLMLLQELKIEDTNSLKGMRDLELLGAAKKLPEAPENAYELFLGDWKVDWSSLGGRAIKKKPDPNGPPQDIKFVSFAALPSTRVEFTGSFNRVSGDAKGGTYQLLQTFTMPGKDGPEAAVVLEGTWSTGTATGNWGEGAPRTRVPTKFETVRVVPSTDEDASRAMLEEAGLGKYFERTAIKAPETYIDLKHISEEMRVHQGESGAFYVLTKIEATEGLPGIEKLPQAVAQLQPKDGCFGRLVLSLEWQNVRAGDGTFEVQVAAAAECEGHPHPLLYLSTSEEGLFVVIIPWYGVEAPVQDEDVFVSCTKLLRDASPMDTCPDVVQLCDLDVRQGVRGKSIDAKALQMSTPLHVLEFSSLSVCSGRSMPGKLKPAEVRHRLGGSKSLRQSLDFSESLHAAVAFGVYFN